MKYNIKLLFSPLKWLCCLLFVVMIPIAMYAPTFYDFTNIASIYIPFVGIVLFSDIVMIDKNNEFAEIKYLSDRKPAHTFLCRYGIMSTVLLLFVLIANCIFRISQIINHTLTQDPVSLLEFALITCGSSLMLGTISMIVTTISSNLYIGYGSSLLYWLYFNINCKSHSPFNLFPFIADPTFYENLLAVQYVLIIILLLLNSFLIRKSPFFLYHILQYNSIARNKRN